MTSGRRRGSLSPPGPPPLGLIQALLASPWRLACGRRVIRETWTMGPTPGRLIWVRRTRLGVCARKARRRGGSARLLTASCTAPAPHPYVLQPGHAANLPALLAPPPSSSSAIKLAAAVAQARATSGRSPPWSDARKAPQWALPHPACQGGSQGAAVASISHPTPACPRWQTHTQVSARACGVYNDGGGVGWR